MRYLVFLYGLRDDFARSCSTSCSTVLCRGLFARPALSRGRC